MKKHIQIDVKIIDTPKKPITVPELMSLHKLGIDISKILKTHKVV